MAYQYRMLFVLLVVFLSNVSSNQDPCESSKYLVDDGGRSSSCDLQYDECDAYIKEGWYHVITLDDDLTIPTSCAPVTKCGTTYPIWMGGTLPAVEDGIVNRTACVSTPGDCCHHSYNIMVKNCTYFFTYYLVRAAGCKERYCFGDSSQCPTSSTPTVSSMSSSTSMEPASSSTPPTTSTAALTTSMLPATPLTTSMLPATPLTTSMLPATPLTTSMLPATPLATSMLPATRLTTPITSTVALSTIHTRDTTSTDGDLTDKVPAYIHQPDDVLCTSSYIFMGFTICFSATTFAMGAHIVHRNKRENRVDDEAEERKRQDVEHDYCTLGR